MNFNMGRQYVSGKIFEIVKFLKLEGKLLKHFCKGNKIDRCLIRAYLKIYSQSFRHST